MADEGTPVDAQPPPVVHIEKSLTDRAALDAWPSLTIDDLALDLNGLIIAYGTNRARCVGLARSAREGPALATWQHLTRRAGALRALAVARYGYGYDTPGPSRIERMAAAHTELRALREIVEHETNGIASAEALRTIDGVIRLLRGERT